MKELSFSYSTVINFSGEIRDHVFTMRMLPRSSDIQEVLYSEISVDPQTNLSYGTDGFGNTTVIGSCSAPHSAFSVISRGIVRTGLCGSDREKHPEKIGIFKYPSALTRPGDAVRELSEKLFSNEILTVREAAKRAMEYLYGNYSYQKGVTWVRTEADEALRTGCGVCQDFTHIFLALMRTRRIPARYCVGMMTGEGESHAWAEVCENGKWYGFDPTNGCAADDRYIRISVGRDALDTRVSLGLFYGFVEQEQKVLVSVHEASREG